jgi:hypothetical protein
MAFLFFLAWAWPAGHWAASWHVSGKAPAMATSVNFEGAEAGFCHKQSLNRR